jgi:hypothetical protein
MKDHLCRNNDVSAGTRGNRFERAMCNVVKKDALKKLLV